MAETTRVLVTGGAGYVGSHVCKALARAGYLPVVVDNLTTGHRSAVRWGSLVEADIRDGHALDGIWARHEPAAVLHFAAKSIVSESVRRPVDYYDNNVLGTLNLLNSMVRNGINNIVFSSSCAVYGLPICSPVNENSECLPINPYGMTKYECEELLAYFERMHGIRWVSLRYFNAAGADEDGELGEDHNPETHAIPLAVRASLGMGPAFSIFGVDYDTADGSAVRDYIDVSDLGQAHVSALEFLARKGKSQAINLGAGLGTSVRQILAAVAGATGQQVPTLIAERRSGDAPILIASTERAAAVLKWRASRVAIADIVRPVVSWELRQKDGQRERMGRPLATP